MLLHRLTLLSRTAPAVYVLCPACTSGSLRAERGWVAAVMAQRSE
jgi:hypothetical protein